MDCLWRLQEWTALKDTLLTKAQVDCFTCEEALWVRCGRGVKGVMCVIRVM